METVAKQNNEELSNLVDRVVQEKIQEYLASLPKRQAVVSKDSNVVTLRTSNCGKGYVLVTRGKRPAIPNLEVIQVAKPSFDLVEGIVYSLSEDKTTILEKNLGQQPSWASVKETQAVEKIRSKIASSIKTEKPSKPVLSDEQKATLQDAEAALAELGLN